jgi:hypothetical protein
MQRPQRRTVTQCHLTRSFGRRGEISARHQPVHLVEGRKFRQRPKARWVANETCQELAFRCGRNGEWVSLYALRPLVLRLTHSALQHSLQRHRLFRLPRARRIMVDPVDEMAGALTRSECFWRKEPQASSARMRPTADLMACAGQNLAPGIGLMIQAGVGLHVVAQGRPRRRHRAHARCRTR